MRFSYVLLAEEIQVLAFIFRFSLGRTLFALALCDSICFDLIHVLKIIEISDFLFVRVVFFIIVLVNLEKLEKNSILVCLRVALTLGVQRLCVDSG